MMMGLGTARRGVRRSRRDTARRRGVAPALVVPALAVVFLGLPRPHPGAATASAGPPEAAGRLLLETGLDRVPEVRARLDFFADGILAQEFKDRLLRGIEIGDAGVEAYYREHRDDFQEPPRVLLQHLLYRDAGKAAGARDRLRWGLAFEAMAGERAADPDLLLVERQWFTPELLIPALKEVAFRLAAGETSAVNRTSHGFHVLRTEAQEPGRARDLESARPEIVERLRQARVGLRFRQTLEETRARPEVHLYLEENIGEKS